jgi:choline-sulfatase
MPIARDAQAPWTDEVFSEHCTDTVPAWTGGQTAQQRMVRSGRWKLIYAHGYPTQLYDLATDPHERVDLAGDARHTAVRERLTARVLDGWNPERVAQRIRERRRDKDVLDAWARSVRPGDDYRWQLLPEHNRLDAVSR